MLTFTVPAESREPRMDASARKGQWRFRSAFPNLTRTMLRDLISRRPAVTTACGALLIIAFSAWAGWAHTDDAEKAWELFAIVLTGFGTTALAAVTGFLAYETREDVRASRRQRTPLENSSSSPSSPILSTKTPDQKREKSERDSPDSHKASGPRDRYTHPQRDLRVRRRHERRTRPCDHPDEGKVTSSTPN